MGEYLAVGESSTTNIDMLMCQACVEAAKHHVVKTNTKTDTCSLCVRPCAQKPHMYYGLTDLILHAENF